MLLEEEYIWCIFILNAFQKKLNKFSILKNEFSFQKDYQFTIQTCPNFICNLTLLYQIYQIWFCYLTLTLMKPSFEFQTRITYLPSSTTSIFDCLIKRKFGPWLKKSVGRKSKIQLGPNVLPERIGYAQLPILNVLYNQNLLILMNKSSM